jgi:hypothetical protein
MPVVQPQRRSARLRLTAKWARRHQKQLKAMEYEGPTTRGRASKSRGSRGTRGGSANPSQDHGTRLQIQWRLDPSRTDRIIEHLLAHPSDCQILFFANAKRSHPDDGPSSGKDKQEICNVIAKAVFEHDHVYSTTYSQFPNKFRDSTVNQINK